MFDALRLSTSGFMAKRLPNLDRLKKTTALSGQDSPNQEEIAAFMRRMLPAPEMIGTEAFDPKYRGMDVWPDGKVFDAFAKVQIRSIAAVYAAKDQISSAAAAIREKLQPEGRLIYVGAGTSGRVGAIDGMELTRTFGFPEKRIVFAMAEDPEFKTGTSREGREDHTWRAVAKVRNLKLTPNDVVIALAASGTTPYTRKFVEMARKEGALTVGISNNPQAPLLTDAEFPILLNTGPEAINGSTRMGAGTAQKSALTMLSSMVMAKLPELHGVYDGLMVNMPPPPNQKLEKRSVRVVSHVAGCSTEEAEEALGQSQGNIKAAVLVSGGMGYEQAKETLDAAGNNLRVAMHKQRSSKSR